MFSLLLTMFFAYIIIQATSISHLYYSNSVPASFFCPPIICSPHNSQSNPFKHKSDYVNPPLRTFSGLLVTRRTKPSVLVLAYRTTWSGSLSWHTGPRGLATGFPSTPVSCHSPLCSLHISHINLAAPLYTKYILHRGLQTCSPCLKLSSHIFP